MQKIFTKMYLIFLLWSQEKWLGATGFSFQPHFANVFEGSEIDDLMKELCRPRSDKNDKIVFEEMKHSPCFESFFNTFGEISKKFNSILNVLFAPKK